MLGRPTSRSEKTSKNEFFRAIWQKFLWDKSKSKHNILRAHSPLPQLWLLLVPSHFAFFGIWVTSGKDVFLLVSGVFRTTRVLVTTEHCWERKNKPSLWVHLPSWLSSGFRQVWPDGRRASLQSHGLAIRGVSRPGMHRRGSACPLVLVLLELGIQARILVHTHV